MCILERHIKLTKAQDALLRKLENGSEVIFKDGHYVVMTYWPSGKGGDAEKIWPSTFYGLYDNELVEIVLEDQHYQLGRYTISDKGRKHL